MAGIAVAALDFAYLLGALGATVEQIEQVGVDGVDFAAYRAEFLLQIVVHDREPQPRRAWKSRM
ncbi:hypothetical protein SDC9_205654 [bioreactor metagenome]|uniref:Uncharacterized protein n=1 Tax=bioreactor metagenome TaxID=1076179 RepID=A0A645J2Q5_9ZZZZ